jgi:hypothetical protein
LDQRLVKTYQAFITLLEVVAVDLLEQMVAVV